MSNVGPQRGEFCSAQRRALRRGLRRFDCEQVCRQISLALEECVSTFGARRAVGPSAASERPANFGAASHAASGNTPTRHDGLSVLRRPAAECAEPRGKSQCTNAFALGNGTSGAVQMPPLRQCRIGLTTRVSSHERRHHQHEANTTNSPLERAVAQPFHRADVPKAASRL